MYNEPRPAGITLLSILHIGGGAVSLFIMANLLRSVDWSDSELQGILNAAGISAFTLIAVFALVIVVALASGFGMWMGHPWGWWTSVSYYVYSILRNAWTIIARLELSAEMAEEAHGVGWYLQKHGTRVVIFSLILLYLCSERRREYFGLGDIKLGKAFGRVVGAVTAVVGALWAVGYIISRVT